MLRILAHSLASLHRAGVLLALFAATGVAFPARTTASAPSLDRPIGEIAATIAKSVTETHLTLAVPDLPTLDGRQTVLGRYVAEELITALYERGVSVVERSLLDRAMSEMQLGLSDLMSATAVKRFGLLVGAQAIVVGTLTDLGRDVKLNARIVAVDTSQVIGAASGLLPVDATTTAMLAQTVAPRRIIPRTPGSVIDGNDPPAGIFWREDFATYEDGDPLPAWGANVVVRKSPTGSSYLGSLIPGDHEVRQALRFPADFSLEFDLATDRDNRVEVPLILVDEKGEELRVDWTYSRWFNPSVTVTLPGVNQQSADVRGAPTLKLIKNGTTYKVYCSGKFVTTGIYTGYGRFVSFKLSFPPEARFTNFVATALR